MQTIIDKTYEPLHKHFKDPYSFLTQEKICIFSKTHYMRVTVNILSTVHCILRVCRVHQVKVFIRECTHTRIYYIVTVHFTSVRNKIKKLINYKN